MRMVSFCSFMPYIIPSPRTACGVRRTRGAGAWLRVGKCSGVGTRAVSILGPMPVDSMPGALATAEARMLLLD